MSDRYQPKDLVGCYAFSRAGHDKGQLYVIVAQETDSVSLCDGRLKKTDAPKKKKLKHVQPVSVKVDEEVLGRLRRGETVRDEEIKFQIKCYLKAEDV